MSNKKGTLEKYFSSASSNTPKRRRNSIGSPEEARYKKIQTKYLESNMEGIMDKISIMFDSKLKNFKEGLPSKVDFEGLRCCMENKLDQLSTENIQLKKKIQEIEKREITTNNVIENLVNNSKSKNLIFRGLKVKNKEDVVKQVYELCVGVLGVTDVVLNKAYYIGTNNIILAEFNTEQTTWSIMKNVSKLKGTGIIVHKDVCSRTRRRRRCLWKVKEKVLALDSKAVVRMRNTHFILNGKKFFWEFGEGLKSGGKDGLKVLEQVMGIPFSEEVRRNFVQVLEEENRSNSSVTPVNAVDEQGVEPGASGILSDVSASGSRGDKRRRAKNLKK